MLIEVYDHGVISVKRTSTLFRLPYSEGVEEMHGGLNEVPMISRMSFQIS